MQNKCKDPCPGVCGPNAECHVYNHNPTCQCLSGYTGQPLQGCQFIRIEQPRPTQPPDPCRPSPCGPYSQCRNTYGVALCSCQVNYIGHPPNCRPECITSSECPLDKTCVSLRCQNPCEQAPCAPTAQCRVVNHSPF